jgi:hypothetical protein
MSIKKEAICTFFSDALFTSVLRFIVMALPDNVCGLGVGDEFRVIRILIMFHVYPG